MATWLDMFTAFNGRFDADEHSASYGEFSFEGRHPIAALEATWIGARYNCAELGLKASAQNIFESALSWFFTDPSSTLSYQADRRVIAAASDVPFWGPTEALPAVTYVDFPDGSLLISSEIKVSAIFSVRSVNLADVPNTRVMQFALPRMFAVVGPLEREGTHVLGWSLGNRGSELFRPSLPMMGDPKTDNATVGELIGPGSAEVLSQIEAAFRGVLGFAERRRPTEDWSTLAQIPSNEFDEAAMQGRPIFDASLFRVHRLSA